jgi:hypothetical protein
MTPLSVKGAQPPATAKTVICQYHYLDSLGNL